MPMTPTQLSLRHFRRQGYTVAIVERWNSHAKIRQDLFGCIDVLAVGNGETVGVQCTSYKNVASRVKKMAEAEAIGDLREAGWRLVVQGWHKPKHRWVVREVDVS